jgi:hypothetical protein
MFVQNLTDTLDGPESHWILQKKICASSHPPADSTLSVNIFCFEQIESAIAFQLREWMKLHKNAAKVKNINFLIL